MKKILILCLVIFAFSCNVQFVPTKSQTALDLVSVIQSDANKAFSELNYNAGYYSQVNDEIDSLISFDKSRAKSGDILKEDAVIQKLFKEYQGEHQTKGEIAESEVSVYKAYFKSAIDPRIISENSLK